MTLSSLLRVVGSAIARLAWTALLGCAASTNSPPEKPDIPAPEGLTSRRMLPLVDGTVSAFRIRSDDGTSGQFVLEIFRPREDLAHLVIAGKTQRLLVAAASIDAATGGSVLRDPLQVGASFQGAFGRVTVVSAPERVTVPAGTFEPCVVVREVSPDAAKSAESSYCDGVGLVRLVVEGGGERVESELLSHGPRVDLGSEP